MVLRRWKGPVLGILPCAAAHENLEKLLRNQGAHHCLEDHDSGPSGDAYQMKSPLDCGNSTEGSQGCKHAAKALTGGRIEYLSPLVCRLITVLKVAGVSFPAVA